MLKVTSERGENSEEVLRQMANCEKYKREQLRKDRTREEFGKPESTKSKKKLENKSSTRGCSDGRAVDTGEF